MHAYNTNNKLWTLYGTKGCNLCNYAEQLLSQCANAYPIAWQHEDIIDLPDEKMRELAPKIPALATATETLYWPFNLADLARLAHHAKQEQSSQPAAV